MIVYLITNKINGTLYVGQTIKSLKHRWQQHLYDAQHQCPYPLHKAIRKCGESSFEIEQVFVCENQEELDFTEIFFIAFMCTKTPSGYNILDGGGIQGAHRGHKHSEETKKKISEVHKGLPAWNKGRKASPEDIEKNRIGHLGILWAPDRKVNNGWLGRTPTEEHKEKIRKAKKGKGKPWSQLRWGKFKRKDPRMAECHPDRKLHSRGLCCACYTQLIRAEKDRRTQNGN